jgi:hypothetical protein
MKCVEGVLGPRLFEKSVVLMKARSDVRCKDIKTWWGFFCKKGL